MMKRHFGSFVLLQALHLPAWALSDSDNQRLADIQKRWAEIQYQTPQGQRAVEFEKLAAQSGAFTRGTPKAAEAWVWHGIVTSSWAGAEGGLGALGKVKDARDALEHAIQLDPNALQGSAYTSLGALYDQVPGWPISFGDEKKAEQLLRKALMINPDGIDSLYFWGDHLYRQGRTEQAREVLLKAKAAALRPGRELADKGRRQDIDTLLEKIQKK